MIPEIKFIQGDITKLQVDAIVNAANKSLLGGGGVDGAIHRAAGPELLAECRGLNGCETGKAKISGAYRLPSKFVIHTVGPVYHGGNNNESQLLYACYANSLAIAREYACKSIAFPNISTGIYGYPKKEAAEIALKAVKDFYTKNSQPQSIFFVCFDDGNYQIYRKLIQEVA